MRPVRVATMVALLCAIVAGCGQSAAPTHPVAQTRPVAQAPPRNEEAAGAAAIRRRALLCFTDQELRLDAGEALGSIEPGQWFRGRPRIVRENFGTAIGNVARSLRTAQRFADSETRPAVGRIMRLAHAGIHQIRRHPWLIIHGGIDAFRRADTVARRARLRHCLS